jgi:hypothetical protein
MVVCAGAVSPVMLIIAAADFDILVSANLTGQGVTVICDGQFVA